MIELNYEAAKEGGARRPPSAGTTSERGSLLGCNALWVASDHSVFERASDVPVRVEENASNKRIEPGSQSEPKGSRRCAVSVTQQQVLDALAKVASPRGVALTNANVLSAITVTDGKVFFSINVDAAEARAWESVRAQAEAAVRAIPGVTAAMIALTAERKAGSPAPARRAAASHRMRTRTACSRSPRTGRRKARRRRCRSSRKFRASPPSSRWRRARAASANRPPRSIWRWACAISACASACSMPIFTAPRCRG